MRRVVLHDKEFELSMPKEDIHESVKKVAGMINSEFTEKEAPVLLSILNGSFIFTADLVRELEINCKISFLKLSSYEGTSTTGNVKKLIGLNEDIEGKSVIIIEDIVDTGITLAEIISLLKEKNPKEIKVATLLYKPESYKGDNKIDYIGKEIPNDFIVGYGLDYDDLGRNLGDIYTVVE
jgi:hypoxanthine phosphoribosyltransferase